MNKQQIFGIIKRELKFSKDVMICKFKGCIPYEPTREDYNKLLTEEEISIECSRCGNLGGLTMEIIDDDIVEFTIHPLDYNDGPEIFASDTKFKWRISELE